MTDAQEYTPTLASTSREREWERAARYEAMIELEPELYTIYSAALGDPVHCCDVLDRWYSFYKRWLCRLVGYDARSSLLNGHGDYEFAYHYVLDALYKGNECDENEMCNGEGDEQS